MHGDAKLETQRIRRSLAKQEIAVTALLWASYPSQGPLMWADISWKRVMVSGREAFSKLVPCLDKFMVCWVWSLPGGWNTGQAGWEGEAPGFAGTRPQRLSSQPPGASGRARALLLSAPLCICTGQRVLDIHMPVILSTSQDGPLQCVSSEWAGNWPRFT